MTQVVHVLLSGGVGSRLWPVSRKSMPKQYIPLFGEKSLFQLAVERNLPLTNRVVVVGNKDNYHLSRSEFSRLGVSRYGEIIEAAPRNTAAAIAFSAFAAEADDVLLVTPSDHIITGEAAYGSAVARAVKLACEGFLVTFGIRPVKPETGYGYIESGGEEVISFREKPDLHTAASFLAAGRFLWNSGMFCFRAGVYLEELRKFEPEIYERARAAWEARTADGFLPEKETALIPARSIDYAIMERSRNIRVVKSDFGWSDLGSFDSIWEHWEEQGEREHFRDNNCVVGATRHVEFLGVSNLVLIETPDVILVLNRDNSQDVKKIFERLEKERPELV